MTREKLLKEEEKSFRDFLDDLHSRNTPGSLSHYEHNLEVGDSTGESPQRVNAEFQCFLDFENNYQHFLISREFTTKLMYFLIIAISLIHINNYQHQESNR